VLEAAAPFAVQVVREVKPDETADIGTMGEGSRERMMSGELLLP
jgi:hypothetical protein